MTARVPNDRSAKSLRPKSTPRTGRSEFEPSADEINVPHLTPNGPAVRPLLGIDFGRKDFADLSFGTRAIVWRDIMFFANGIFALNDDGLRNDTVIPTVGLEGTF